MSDVLAVILGGGRGARLFPLTAFRSKPAVPLGGKYRLVDVPISNCLNSAIRDIYVLTQFNSASLNRHIAQSYKLDPFSSGSIEILAAQQTLNDTQWYQGTADAVRQNLRHFARRGLSEVLILSGDQLYQMDFRNVLQFHRSRGADITVAAVAVPRAEVPQLGILQANENGLILRFVEKPSDQSQIDSLAAPRAIIDAAGVSQAACTHIASMGIYVFDPDVLQRVLQGSCAADFGREVIPNAVGAMRVYAYAFHGYWEDIGTIKSFHRANLALASPCPPFNFYDERRRVFTHPRFLPGSKVNSCQMRSSVLCDGCIVDDSRIEESIVGVRTMIGSGTTILRSVIMGADYFETEEEKADNALLGRPNVGIGKGCLIDGAIIDKNARVGKGCSIRNRQSLTHHDGDGFYIRDGIVVVPKDSTIPDGTVI